MKKQSQILKSKVVLITALLGIGIITAFVLNSSSNNKLPSPTTPTVTNQTNSSEIPPPAETTDANATVTNKVSQNDLLLYLIEEEKLAHDVYTVFYELYGANVFGNILKSEETHQSRVLTLLEARNIADPRSKELGVFNNPDLQTLYSSLIAQGKQSALEAYKVGKAIEEKDISDIAKQLATATESDIISTLEALRSGSENHLRAFNRQINKY